MNPPAFQFYPADYLADANVQMMSLEDEGAYIRLLCYCWREGSIPDDDEALKKLTKGGSTNLRRVVQECFVPDPSNPGRLIHKRLDEERRKQLDWREKSRQGGVKSGSSRRSVLKGGSTTVEAERLKGGSRVVEPKANSSSSSSSSYNPLVRPPNGSVSKKAFSETIGAFERFWQAYPKRYNRMDAEHAFFEVHGPDHIQDMLQAIDWQKHSDEWRKNDGQFIPQPGNWLRDHRWEDVPVGLDVGITIPKPKAPIPDWCTSLKKHENDP